MITRFFLPLVMALSLAFLPTIAHARKPRPPQHHVVIESISADSITIDEPGGTKTYKIGPHTEITFKNNPATVSQLQSGMRVQVTPDAADDSVAGEIDADDPPHDPTPVPRVTPPPNF